MSPTTCVLPIADIYVAPQARKRFQEAGLASLAGSISEVGLLQPLLVRREGRRHVVLDGERRLRACTSLGMTELPVVILDDALSIADVLTRQLACDLQREDLTPVERAEAVQQVMESGGMTADQVAKRLGQSPATISRTLSILKLPESLLAEVSSGRIPPDTAYSLARVEDPKRQSELAAEVMEGRLTRDALVRKLKRIKRSVAAPDHGPARVTALLTGGRSITVAGKGLSWESLIDTLEQLLSRAKKSKAQGLSLPTFVRTLRDQAAS